MKACEKLLGLCPEILTAWNYRRETIEARTGDAATTSEGGDEGEGDDDEGREDLLPRFLFACATVPLSAEDIAED